MTTDERIAEIELAVDKLHESGMWSTSMDGEAIAMEIRALRLMLREEIREAAWRLAAPAQPLPRPDDPSGHIPRPGWTGEQWEAVTSEGPLASRKAPPLEDTP